MLATDNPHKQEKLKWIVDKYFRQIDLPTKTFKVKEDGSTFEQIARKKALQTSKNYDGFTIATDAGMEIPALKNWNSLLTRRFIKKQDSTDFDRMDALLAMATDLKDRRMRWTEAVAIAYKGRVVFSATVEGAKGVLQKEYDRKKYKKGIWLCSLWYFPTYRKNYFDLKPREVDFAEVSWFRLKKEVEKFFSTPFSLRREQKSALKDLTLKEAFTIKNWPHDFLMETLKEKVAPFLETDLLVDKNDLRYQVLFRLTTFRLSEIFDVSLERYLKKQGAHKSWEKILSIKKQDLEKYKINEALVKQVVQEQKEVAAWRLRNTKLPLKEILIPRNRIFSEKGWVIRRSSGALFAVRKDTKVELRFGKVPKRYAQELHNKLHYIHCARVEKAFGIFIKGEKIPFSVLATQKIDREYKKKAVLLRGFDFDKVVDFTRLYSFNGAPLNTSSAIFGLTRDYLRKNTEVQATLSAFMPSYANGMSMFAGGLDQVLIAKPLSHTFERILGTNLYQQVVKRVVDESNEDFVFSKIPLLPTLELLSEIRKPPMTPRIEIENKMLVLDKSI